MRTFALWNAWLSAVTCGVCLLRLGFKDWPVVIKWERWEYVLKVVSASLWAGWGFNTVYHWMK